MKRFDGKVALITGGASGIGLATAARLAGEGARLVLVDLDAELLEREAAALDLGDRCRTVAADVAQPATAKAYVAAALEAFGRIDAFFNNAGIVGPIADMADYPDASFQQVMAVNAGGVFHGLASVLPVMRQQGSGAVVNTASVMGISAIGEQSGYTASKHAVIGLTRNAALEYCAHGIQVNAIAPGAIVTPMFENAQRKLVGNAWEDAARAFAQTNPMKRFGKADEVAALVAFLLGGEAGYINGAVIPIDGGQSIRF